MTAQLGKRYVNIRGINLAHWAENINCRKKVSLQMPGWPPVGNFHRVCRAPLGFILVQGLILKSRVQCKYSIRDKIERTSKTKGTSK